MAEKNKTTHSEQLIHLRKIEGQVRGVQKMIGQERYCVDILTQLHSIIGAILHVEDNILAKHLKGCVMYALKGKSKMEKIKKIDEVIELVRKFRQN